MGDRRYKDCCSGVLGKNLSPIWKVIKAKRDGGVVKVLACQAGGQVQTLVLPKGLVVPRPSCSPNSGFGFSFLICLKTVLFCFFPWEWQVGHHLVVWEIILWWTRSSPGKSLLLPYSFWTSLSGSWRVDPGYFKIRIYFHAQLPYVPMDCGYGFR
jgi:hypothetical protein